MVLGLLSAGFQSLPALPTSKVGPSGAASRLGGPVYVLGPSWSLQWTLLWGWEFLLLPPQAPWVFSIRGLWLYFPTLEHWGCVVCFTPLPFLPVNLSANVGLQGPQPLFHWESSPASCTSLPPLPVWMNVSLTSWLSDFHTVWFSVSSGCFLFLNCCCPSFACARRHSVSTYTSILAGSLTLLSKCIRFCAMDLKVLNLKISSPQLCGLWMVFPSPFAYHQWHPEQCQEGFWGCLRCYQRLQGSRLGEPDLGPSQKRKYILKV